MSVVDVASTAADHPPVLDDRALLILYLVNALQWDAARAANLYGTYTMSV